MPVRSPTSETMSKPVKKRTGQDLSSELSNDTSDVVDSSDSKIINEDFDSLKSRFITMATGITQDFEETCDMLLIIRTVDPSSNTPKISSLATRALKPILQEPESKQLISELLHAKTYDKNSFHTENTSSDKDSTFGKMIEHTLELVKEMCSYDTVEILYVAIQKTKAEKPDLHIFSTGMFRSLVIEGSPGRERIILEASKPRVESPYAWVSDALIILFLVVFLGAFVMVLGLNFMTFAKLFYYQKPAAVVTEAVAKVAESVTHGDL
ncbi:hypothetical protein HK098_002022 [Nowakowskiella sp. JEL0407]|nr:hypothetical protein HK098_002022 [Nowakowskiella sp. JEL0407]